MERGVRRGKRAGSTLRSKKVGSPSPSPFGLILVVTAPGESNSTTPPAVIAFPPLAATASPPPTAKEVNSATAATASPAMTAATASLVTTDSATPAGPTGIRGTGTGTGTGTRTGTGTGTGTRTGTGTGTGKRGKGKGWIYSLQENYYLIEKIVMNGVHYKYVIEHIQTTKHVLMDLNAKSKSDKDAISTHY